MLKIVERPTNRKPRFSSEITTISPSVARAMLDKNLNNRKPSSKHVAALARDMRNGKWQLTGDAVRFDTDGTLIDGQHRLMACIAAETGFQTVIIYGLEPATKFAIDANKTRSPADFLHMDGLPNANHLQAAARFLLAIKAGGLRGNVMKFTIAETLDCIAKHKKLGASVRLALGPQNLISIIQLAVLHYVGVNLIGFPDRAEAFLNVWHSGIPDYTGDPVHRYRERLIRAKAERATNIERHQKTIGLAHAWNLFARKQPLNKTVWPKEATIDGLNPSKI